MRALIAVLILAGCGCAVKEPTPAQHAEASAYGIALQGCVVSSATWDEALACKKRVDARFPLAASGAK